MTKEELQNKIQELTDAANGLEEPDKTFALSDVDKLKIELEVMALADVLQKLEQIQIPDLQEMDKHIKAAKDATNIATQRVYALNFAIKVLKTGLGIVL